MRSKSIESRRETKLDVLCIPVEFTGPVGAKYEIDGLTRPECLIQYSFIVDLSSPNTSLNTKMQIILSELHMIRTICAPN